MNKIAVTKDKNIQRRVLPDNDPNRVLIQNSVSDILKTVYENGDRALLDYTEIYDGIRPTNLEVSPAEIDELASKVPEEVLVSLKKLMTEFTVITASRCVRDFVSIMEMKS